MSRSSYADILAQVAEREPCPRLNAGLADGNRISLTNWTFSGDCLIEHWPDGSPRYVVPLAQIALIEFPNPD